MFGTPDRARVYIGSADYMPRNTIHRVEVAVPLLDPAIRARVLHIFDVYLHDNCKARLQQPDGTYVLTAPAEGEESRNAQEQLFDEAYAAAPKRRTRKPAAKPDAPNPADAATATAEKPKAWQKAQGEAGCSQLCGCYNRHGGKAQAWQKASGKEGRAGNIRNSRLAECRAAFCGCAPGVWGHFSVSLYLLNRMGHA